MKLTGYLAILMALTVLLFPLCALAQDGPFTLSKEELSVWREQLLKDSIQDNVYHVAPAENGRYTMEFAWYTLLTDTERLSAATRIYEVRFERAPEGENTPADIHGVRPGDSLEKLLSAWPDENESLAGTREEAVLYALGQLPGQAAYGVVERDGQRIDSVIHRHYMMTSAGVSMSEVYYSLQDGFVDAIAISFDVETLTVQDAIAEMDAARDVQAMTEYSAFLTGAQAENGPFGRDDLIFSGIDFLDVTPQSLQALLGDGFNEKWADDDERSIRVLEWDAVTAAFLYGDDDHMLRVDNIVLDSDILIGPRGLTVGDTLDVLLGRFPHDAAAQDGIHQPLYGAEGDSEYAVMDSVYPGQAELRYVCKAAEDQSVMMVIYVSNGVITQIVLQML